jgi:hypothetical protein
VRKIWHTARAWLPARFLRPALLVEIALAISVASQGAFLVRQLSDKAFLRTQGMTMARPSSPRTNMLRNLESRPGAHLVFVHYSADYSLHDEWVYNAADMPSARVIFAHDLGVEKNRELIERQGDRQVWLATVTPDEKLLIPYGE